MTKKPVTFAARLLALRRQAGLSAYELARRSGVSQQMLSKLKQGSMPSWATVCRLADALGVTPNDFL